MVEFSKNEKVIYPLKGIGEIVDIVEDKVLDEVVKMYKIKLKDMEAYIPVSEIAELGIRRPLSVNELDEILSYMEKPDTGFNKDWIKRFDENKLKSSKGSIYEFVDVIKICTILSSKNSLNKYERELFTECKKYFTEEIAYILVCTKEEANHKFDHSLKKLMKNLELAENLLINAKKMYAKEKYFQAINDFMKVIEIDKNNIESMVLIADSYYKMENFPKAEEYFELARKIDEDNYLFNLKYGYYIFNQNKKEEALNYFKKASLNIEDQKEKKELYEFLKINYEE